MLAAGLGTRLDPLTRLVAKAALPLSGEPVIVHALGWLRREGARDVVINLHHRPESIAAVVGDGSHLGLSVRYSWEREVLGSAGGPRHALALLDDPLLLVNAEPLVDFALEPMLENHLASGAEVTLAAMPNPAPDEFNGLRADEAGVVQEVVPKGLAAGTWHFVGVQLAAAGVFAGLPDGEPAETIHGLYRPLIAEGRVRIHAIDGPVTHIGTLREYLDAAIAFGRVASSDSVIDPGVAHVAASACLRRTVVWPEATIGAGADLCGCIVTRVTIPPGFTARDAAIVPGDLVRPGDRAERRGALGLFPIQ